VSEQTVVLVAAADGILDFVDDSRHVVDVCDCCWLLLVVEKRLEVCELLV